MDSTGKLPDGILSGSTEFCEGVERLVMYGISNFTCDTEIELEDGTTFSFQFLKSLPPVPRGNTKAWGSVEGCIATTRYSNDKIDIITLMIFE